MTKSSKLKRFVYINDDEQQPTQDSFCDNRISNRKYTSLNFLPKNLMEQFRFSSSIFLMYLIFFFKFSFSNQSSISFRILSKSFPCHCLASPSNLFINLIGFCDCMAWHGTPILILYFNHLALITWVISFSRSLHFVWQNLLSNIGPLLKQTKPLLSLVRSKLQALFLFHLVYLGTPRFRLVLYIFCCYAISKQYALCNIFVAIPPQQR